MQEGAYFSKEMNTPSKSDTKQKNRPWRGPGGIRIRPLLNRSGVYSYRVEVPGSITGKRKLKAFKTPGEAEAYASIMHVQRQNQGLAAFAMTDSDRTDAQNALKILKPLGASLMDAAKFYAKHFSPEGGDLATTDLVARYIKQKGLKKLRDRSMQDLEHRLGRFTEAFGSRLVRELSSDEIKKWIYEDPTLAPQTQMNYRRVLHGLFGFAVTGKFVAENPIKALPIITIDERSPEILTSGQARSLLQAAAEHPELEFGPYLTLGLFCGIRSKELEQLAWENVILRHSIVTIPSTIAKKRRLRNIPLEPNAIAWLNFFGVKTSGPISPVGLSARRRFRHLLRYANQIAEREAAKGKFTAEYFAPIPKWPSNGLRHSFASNFYAWTGNAQETCARLGQKNDDVLFQHYRALMRRVDGHEYFQIIPPLIGDGLTVLPQSQAAA